MKIRESGMPSEEMWEKFFDIPLIFSKLRLNDSINDVAEFGSGYGTFTIPASKIIKGTLFAYDIDESMIKNLNKKVKENNIENIKVIQADFVNDGTKLNKEAVDYTMLFNILHAEEPFLLLNEACRILKPGGKAGVIHWIYSDETPRGPSLDIRPTKEQCINWMKEAGFEIKDSPVFLPPYHYGIIGYKNK
ncbi:MAG: methyltransferase type 11 [Ignavibacteria bacterium GWA2_35_9]|nr:MAG: methyltransferase type 11 [Ignavibacteria bacterium GWA2_35_9]OGU46800.1 MAG: methyltransferase type 11 [Ignavibacteria bacterium GWB2_36_8]OGU52962.1 MAG: methyltransferase type 11 [Ignavibacteria bacterium GWC2_36_12]